MSRTRQNNSNRDGPKRSDAASHQQLQLSKSLQMALSIPLLFSSTHSELGVAEVADLIGLGRPSTHRYIATFVRLGYLEQYDATRKYRLAARAADSGLSLIGAMRRSLPAVTVLEELRDRIGYTVSMGALNGNKVTYIHRLLAHRPGQHHIDQEIGVGAHVPIYCTALGKALLTSLTKQARRKLISQLDFVPWGPRAFVAHEQLIQDLEEADYREPIVSDEEFMYAARSIALYVPRPRTEPHIAIDVTVPGRPPELEGAGRTGRTGLDLRCKTHLRHRMNGRSHYAGEYLNYRLVSSRLVIVHMFSLISEVELASADKTRASKRKIKSKLSGAIMADGCACSSTIKDR